MSRARTAVAALTLGLAACTAYPVSITDGPRPDPVMSSFSRNVVWPLEIELADASYVALFTIDDDLSMQYPLVPVSRLESIYGGQVDIVNDRVVDFRSRHPWPHPDSVPDPFAVPGERFAAGTHDLQQPYVPYIVQELVYPHPCTYFLLVASDTPLSINGIFDLEWARLPSSPREIAQAVVEAVGLEPDGIGWSAQLQQGRCRRPS